MGHLRKKKKEWEGYGDVSGFGFGVVLKAFVWWERNISQGAIYNICIMFLLWLPVFVTFEGFVGNLFCSFK